MVKIERLPSGSYRARVHLGGGKYKSITGKDKKAVQLEAAQYEADIEAAQAKENDPHRGMTVGEAMEKYIALKSAVLSPSTLLNYDIIRRNRLQELCAMKVADITQEDVQRAINEDTLNHKPKSVRNAHGFLSAVLAVYREDLRLNTTLPQRKKPQIMIPTQEEVNIMFDYFRGTPMEVPFALAACCGLRESEISGLRWDCVDFDKNRILITEVIVRHEDGQYNTKDVPKSFSGDRSIRMYPFIRDILIATDRTGEHVTTLMPQHIYQRFVRALPKMGLPHYRFHDLRHYLVSVMLSLNIPKTYIADYVGHANERMIDEVYGHIMAEKKHEVEDIMDEYFQKSAMKSATNREKVL